MLGNTGFQGEGFRAVYMTQVTQVRSVVLVKGEREREGEEKWGEGKEKRRGGERDLWSNLEPVQPL